MCLSFGPIGIFDSGYGGLTILKEFRRMLPEYDYLYLGDNARAPYGNRSFDTVYKYTLQCVEYLFNQNCSLIILACNTASAKALRSIQQINIPKLYKNRRVLGVLRPTVEVLGDLTKSRHVGILGTMGTIRSESYPIEIKKMFPDIVVTSLSCPMWVPLVENGEIDSPGADYFVSKKIDELFSKDRKIDTLVLGCTHYPLLIDVIKKFIPPSVKIVSQGEYVASSLIDYLRRHSEIEEHCSKNGMCNFLTTESEEKFKECASLYIHEFINAKHISVKE